MHDGTVAQSDAWLKQHLDGYAQWAKTNNSMLVVVTDENSSDTNLTTPVAAFIVGQGVQAGTVQGGQVNHNMLYRTLEDWTGAALTGTVASPLPGLPIS